MIEIERDLEALIRSHPKFLHKGGLCVGLHLTRCAEERGLPIPPESMRTAQGGQVEGLGKARIQKILAEFGITQVLAEEGGRTSRGSLGLMERYLSKVLNTSGSPDLKAAMRWWITKVRLHFARSGPKFSFDSGISVRANLDNLFRQALDIQKNSGGASYVGAMLQHLVGAKLDLILGPGIIQHHGSSVADGPTDRAADFQINSVAIHVTTAPSEALVRKARANLRDGLKPLIITLPGGVAGLESLLGIADCGGRVDVLDAVQFLTANVYERSLFQAGECLFGMRTILERYNEIVADCETDPVLSVRI